MKIGVHPSNLHLRLARGWPNAFARLDPEFVAYPEGRDTGHLLSKGLIDIGGTGSTPPILAESEGLAVVYVAASAPRPANGGIFVRADGPIRCVADLRGLRITLVDGSFHTYLLARSLEAEGLLLPDVERIEIGAAESLQALLDRRVDAWIAMAPRLENALARDDLRLIARCGATIPNRSLFWTVAERGLSIRRRAEIVSELTRIGNEVALDRKAAAARLAGDGADEAGLAAWEDAIASRDFSIAPADGAIVAEQQAEADTLHRHGYLQRPLQIGGGDAREARSS